MKNLWRTSIGIRFSILTAVVVFLVTLVSIAGESYLTYRREAERLDRELVQIQQSHLPSIVSSLWLTDFALVRNQAEAIARFPYIARVEITDAETAQVYAAGQESVHGLTAYREPIIYGSRGEEFEIGSLVVWADERMITQTALRETLYSLAVHLAVALAVSIVISLLFRQKIGTHLVGLAEHVQRNAVDEHADEYRIHRHKRYGDELDRLVDAVNNMRSEAHRHLAEREMMMAEVQHRIKNTMNTMVSLLSLQADSIDVPEAVEALNDARSRFRSMEVLYGQLYRTESHDLASVKEYLTSLVGSVVALFPGREGVETRIEIDDFSLGAKRLSALGMIVNELVTNAMKYAYGTSGRSGGTLAVGLHIEGDRAVLSVRDDGPGLPDGFDIRNSTGFGLTMVSALGTQLGGELEARTEAGAVFTVSFPLDEAQ